MSRKKSKTEKRILEAVPPLDPEAEKAKADEQNQKRANARLVWKKLQVVETASISLREITRFDPPDPAGPPNKHVILNVAGADFLMIAAVRARTITFLEALDRFEDVARFVTDHPTEKIDEEAIPQLHITLSRTPEEIASYPKKTNLDYPK